MKNGTFLSSFDKRGFLTSTHPSVWNYYWVNTGGADAQTDRMDAVVYGLAQGMNSPLYRIDPKTGAATEIGPTGMSVTAGDLAVDPTTGVIYGTPGLVSPDSRILFSVNPHTAAGNGITGPNIAGAQPVALAFDAAGHLYMQWTSAEELLEVDKENGSIIRTVASAIRFGFSPRPATVSMKWSITGGSLNDLIRHNEGTL